MPTEDAGKLPASENHLAAYKCSSGTKAIVLCDQGKSDASTRENIGYFYLGDRTDTEHTYVLYRVPKPNPPPTPPDAGQHAQWVDPVTHQPSNTVRVCVGPSGATVPFTEASCCTTCTPAKGKDAPVVCEKVDGTNLKLLTLNKKEGGAKAGTTVVCLDDCKLPGNALTVDWTTEPSGKCQ